MFARRRKPEGVESGGEATAVSADAAVAAASADDDLTASGPPDPTAMLPFIDEDDPLIGADSIRADPDGSLSIFDPITNQPVPVAMADDTVANESSDVADDDLDGVPESPATQPQEFDRSENRETKLRIRRSDLAQQQGREGRIDQLETTEFDPNLPAHVRGWMRHERRLVGQGRQEFPRTPPGFVLAHGRVTPAREGYDYSNSRLQNAELNQMEERVRRRAQAAQRRQRAGRRRRR